MTNSENLVTISLADLIKRRKFDRVDTDITDKLFPKPDRLWNDYKEFHFGICISSDEATKRMQDKGYEPANSHELLLWNKWNNEKGSVVALGAFATINGNRPILMLYVDWRTKRILLLEEWKGVWNSSCRFLGVRISPDAHKPTSYHGHYF